MAVLKTTAQGYQVAAVGVIRHLNRSAATQWTSQVAAARLAVCEDWSEVGFYHGVRSWWQVMHWHMRSPEPWRVHQHMRVVDHCVAVVGANSLGESDLCLKETQVSDTVRQ